MKTIAPSESDLISRLRLYRSRRVGPQTFRRLLEEHGTAGAALAALPDIAKAAGTHDYVVYRARDAEQEYRQGLKMGARLLALGTPGYPEWLAGADDAPPVLWALGQLGYLERPMVSMVGARNASSLGRRMARILATDLGSAGFCIVSGLARGVDAAAHTAALPTGTIAVIAGGLDIFAPAENTDLQRQIAQRGVLLTEQPFGLTPFARHFPQRNRIIAALSPATVVVEAAARSGSLLTARAALDQGRDVFAVPGHPFDNRASGCNALIRDGAGMVRSAADIIETLQHTHAPTPIAAPRATPPPEDLENRLLTLLSTAPTAEDQIIRDLNVPSAAASATIIALEMSGRLLRQPGGMLSIA
jgi:DNA processing protein